MGRAWLSLLVLALAVSASRAVSPSKLLTKRRAKYLPVVLWHGLGDSCCHPDSMGAIARALETELGTFVHSISTGHGETSDVISSFFGDVNQQVDAACAELAAMPELEGGFVGVGFSQGGQFLRAVVQRCQHTLPGPMHTLVTMGSQHQGVMAVPGCWGPSFNATPTALCKAVEAILSHGAYYDWVQRSVVQAAYWKDPYHLEEYRQHSSFLADINAESALEPAKPHYRTNLASLASLALFQFDNDVTVVPKESSHFGWFDGKVLVPMEETDLWAEDRIGLRLLASSGRLALKSAPGFHMQFTLHWFTENVIWPHLAVPTSAAAAREAGGPGLRPQARWR